MRGNNTLFMYSNLTKQYIFSTETMESKVRLWKRFVEYKYYFATSKYIDNELLALNCFHKTVTFIIEIEKDNTISNKKPGKIKPTVYRKKTCTDLYLNWYSYAPKSWKWGTSKTFVRRAHVHYSTAGKHLEDELKYIEKTFNEINNYLHWVLKKGFKQIIKITQSGIKNKVEEAKNASIKNHLLFVPYKAGKGRERNIVTPWCSGYHYCTTSFNKAWAKVLYRFKSCSWRVRDFEIVRISDNGLAGNKAKRLLLINHFTKNSSSSSSSLLI